MSRSNASNYFPCGRVVVVMRSVLLLALTGFAVSSALQAVPPLTVDLNTPARQRWVPAVKKVVAAHGWENSLGGLLEFYKPQLQSINLLRPQTYPMLENVLQNRFPEQYQELLGIGDAIAELGYGYEYNVSAAGLLVALPFFYELAHVTNWVPTALTSQRGGPVFELRAGSFFNKACTGILSLPPDGTSSIIHGRNLDESPKQSRNMTLNITVTKGGVYQYHVFDYTWISTGFYTSSRVGGVTLEENWRNVENPTFEQFTARVQNPNFVPVPFLFRHIQDQLMGFDDAVSYLMSATLASPGYIIMSGPGRRGAILTLSFNNTKNVREGLDDSSNVTFKVQTNYDRWLPDPSDDPRRTVAERVLGDVEGPARRGTELGVWMALSTFPVHNPGTMFTVLMRADRAPEGYVRRQMLPKQ